VLDIRLGEALRVIFKGRQEKACRGAASTKTEP
jgi:hypothetical protein